MCLGPTRFAAASGRGQDALVVRFLGLDADHEQVQDHRDFRDRARDDDESMGCLADVGKQERCQQVYEIADATDGEQDAEPLREQPSRFEGEVSQRYEPQAEENLRAESPVVLDVEQEQDKSV